MKTLILFCTATLILISSCTNKKRKVRITKAHDGKVVECVMTGKKFRIQYMPDRNGYHLQPTDTLDFVVDPIWGDTAYMLGFKTL